jgi:hypothetical protein
MDRLRLRRRHAYTLPEILIASALTALLLVGALRWVVGLIDVSATHADLNRPRLTARYLTEQFSSDLSAATVCDRGGLSGVLHYLDAQLLGVYLDDDGDGDADLVWWRHHSPVPGEDPSRIERAVVTGDGTCRFSSQPPSTGWSLLAAETYADRGEGGTLPAFAPVGSDYSGPCDGASAEICLFHAVTLRVVPVSPATGMPTRVDTTVTLNLSESRL